MSRKIKSSDFDKHLKGKHLNGPTALTIMHVGLEAMGRPVKRKIQLIAGSPLDNDAKQEEKIVLFFRETNKDLPLSDTNRHALEDLLSDDPANWIGKIIVLEPVEVDSFGKKQLPARVTGLGKLQVDHKTGEIKSTPTHWYADPAQKAKFAEQAKALVMGKEEILSALNVETLSDYKESCEQACKALNDWRASHPVIAPHVAVPEQASLTGVA